MSSPYDSTEWLNGLNASYTNLHSWP